MQTLKNLPFIHLRLQSSYSLSSGALSIKEIIKLCLKYKMPAAALSDKGNLFGSLEFSSAASSNSIQPIMAATVKIAIPKDIISETPKNLADEILLIARNKAAYKNLLKIVSQTFLKSASETENSITLEHLKELSTDIICLAGHHQSLLGDLIINKQFTAAENLIKCYNQIFTNHLYLEITRTGETTEENCEKFLLKQAISQKLPIVATNDIYFATRDMHQAHDILSCIATSRYEVETDRKKISPEHYFKSSREMQRIFADLPEALENTVNIAKRCSYFAKPHPPLLPHCKTQHANSEEEELHIIAKQGLEEKLKAKIYENFTTEEKQKYFDRLDYEIGIINKMGFPGYFLIVADFIQWSKTQNIPVGPGRGSGAGSIVAWSLKITDLDPIELNLLFERFLNPQRVSMPDFDIDFCQERRDEVINYVSKKYGNSHVAQIITFGKLQAKAVIKDVGRVLQMGYAEVDRISKMIPFNPVNPVTLQQAIDLDKSLQNERKHDPQIAKLLDIGLKLEGLHRHASTHAAGIVIGDRPLVELLPLYKDPRSNMPIVQYSMKYAEQAGLVKFDFLGLKTLTIISKALALLKQQDINLSIDDIPIDDQETYKLLSSGNSIGIFQLESIGMRDCLKQMKPDKFEDIIALISLYRPGPMDNIPSYIARKHGNEDPEYPHPMLEDCLEETFGVIIYQEQVMEIAQILAGYSLGDADLLRRAMGKKIKAEMDAQREIFIKGALNNNIIKEQASEIFDLVAKFAGYGFNKSHAAAYALIGYQTAYLKAHYPTELIIAILNVDLHDTDKICTFLQEAKRLEIPIDPPSINKSLANFSIEIENGVKKIIYGLGAIKSVGKQSMLLLEKIRNEKGLFKDIFDLAEKTGPQIINKKQLEALTRSGALDEIITNRNQIIANTETIIKYTSTFEKESLSNQTSLFSNDADHSLQPTLVKANEWDNKKRLQHEFAALGFFLTQHPLDSYQMILKKLNITESLSIEEKCKEFLPEIFLAGVILNFKQRFGKNGRFTTLQLSDCSGTFELSIFDDDLIERSRPLLVNGQNLFITASARRNEGNVRVNAINIESLEEKIKKQPIIVTIEIDNKHHIQKLRESLNSEGDIAVTLKFEVTENGYKHLLNNNENYYISEESYQQITSHKQLSKIYEAA
jgi:DNA polymerase III subunit alpha